MGLTAGDKLGPYEIIASIGKGGMGEVYRARPDYRKPTATVFRRFSLTGGITFTT